MLKPLWRGKIVSSRSGKKNHERFPHRTRLGVHLCRYCGAPLTGRKTSFCGQECLRDFFMQTDWKRVRAVVYERDGHICMICGKYVKKDAFHVDHIRPISKGGAEFALENLRLTCGSCNLSKSAKYDRRMGGMTEYLHQKAEAKRKQAIRRRKK